MGDKICKTCGQSHSGFLPDCPACIEKMINKMPELEPWEKGRKVVLTQDLIVNFDLPVSKNKGIETVETCGEELKAGSFGTIQSKNPMKIMFDKPNVIVTFQSDKPPLRVVE